MFTTMYSTNSQHNQLLNSRVQFFFHHLLQAVKTFLTFKGRTQLILSRKDTNAKPNGNEQGGDQPISPAKGKRNTYWVD